MISACSVHVCMFLSYIGPAAMPCVMLIKAVLSFHLWYMCSECIVALLSDVISNVRGHGKRDLHVRILISEL